MLEARPHREVCAACLRPISVCCCALLPRLTSGVRLVVVQHPREHRKPIGTAWMAVRAVEHAELFVTTTVDEGGQLSSLLADPARPAVLLWPGEGARDLEHDPPALPVTLVVVDGTWSTARKLLQRNPVLAALPRVRINPRQASRYRIRREPRAECLSTVEAVSQALGFLDRAPGKFDPMLAAFERMVDMQIEHQAKGGGRREKRPRGERPPRPPPPELAGVDDCVVVFAEANAFSYLEPDRPTDELLHVVLRRIGDGATLDLVTTPTRALAPTALAHAGLPPDALTTAASPEEARARLAAFFRPTDKLAGWGRYARDLLASFDPSVPRAHLDLKPLAARTSRGRLGSLEDAAARLGLHAPPLGAGRAGRRLGLAVALVEHLCDRYAPRG